MTRKTSDPATGILGEMKGDLVEARASQEIAVAHLEVEFALVLARTIDSIKSDPEQLRGAVYELARQKLREEFTREDVSQIAHMTAALEVAIEGVEAHSKKEEERQATRTFGPPQAPQALSDRQYPATVQVLESPGSDAFMPRSGRARPSLLIAGPDQEFSTRRTGFSAPLRFALVIGLLLAVALVVLQRSGQFARIKSAEPVEAIRETSSPGKTDSAPRGNTPAEPEPPKVAPLLPTSFGIYAVSGDKLYELDPLQGYAPDIRVAISAVITTPSRAVLPDGNLKFIVFRRDSGGGAPDQADVRIVAKIEQATTFDAAGKPVISKTADDNWVIRNISFPYRTAPVKDNPEMYEIQSRDPGAELTPGRYALIIKGQSFDFTVTGQVTDTRQCLERLAAANGTFYSACQKLP
jgi:hypothetical protein